MINVGLGNPIAEQEFGTVLRLDRVLLKCVAVIVVANVVVVEPWEAATFVVRTDVFVVPVGHHDFPIGVEARNHDSNRFVEDP